MGLPISEIARRLQLSERTIAYVARSVKEVLGDVEMNAAALVQRAYVGGVLLPGATLSKDGSIQYSTRSVTRRSLGLDA